MTRKQQLAVLKRQIKELTRNFQESCLKSAETALKGGFVPDEYKTELENGNYLLAKAIVDSKMRSRPFEPFSSQTTKEFNNIHTCL